MIMTKDWNKFAVNTFYAFIQHINNFDEFNDKLKTLSNDKNTLKGDILEYFSKLYFELLSENKKLYKHYYLYSEIPDNIKQLTNLPSSDKGIDGILITNDDKLYAVQVKFRSDQKNIPFSDFATFSALTFGSNVVNITGGTLLTTCFDVCSELKNDKYTNITYNHFDKCDNIFWNNARNHILGHKNKYIDMPFASLAMHPLAYQKPIFSCIKKYYNNNANGRLYLPCGTGKTFIGYWTAIKVLSCDTIFIVVPSLYLLSATYDAWLREIQLLKSQHHFTLIGSDINNRCKCKHKPVIDIKIIKRNIKKYAKHIIITTYQSSDLLLKASKKLNHTFDFGIFDEAHRTTGEPDKTFTCLLSNNFNVAKKRLFMTATEKIYKYSKSNMSEIHNQSLQVLSMDDEKIYGKIIYKRSTRQAINANQLVDYKIIAPFIATDNYDELIKQNKSVAVFQSKTKYKMKLLLMCAMIKETMTRYKFTHLLIFSNTNEKAKKIHDILKHIFNDDDNKMYLKCMSSDDNMTTRNNEVRKFEKAMKGVISSARIFGEGINIKTCDAVCFADNKSSTVDIVQYVGRCLRKCSSKPDKIGHVLIPFLLETECEDDFFSETNKAYLKLRRIMKTLGNTDDMITEKFTLMNCSEKIDAIYEDEKKDHSIISEKSSVSINLNTFTKYMISQIFDKTGNRNMQMRNMIIRENNKRWIEKKTLIDTKQKCLTFLENTGFNCDELIISNWIKYCLGYKLFEKMKQKYYYDKDELLLSCQNNHINTCSDYKNYNHLDNRLPSIDYINNGFYHDIDPKFNLQLLLNSSAIDNDI